MWKYVKKHKHKNTKKVYDINLKIYGNDRKIEDFIQVYWTDKITTTILTVLQYDSHSL